MADNGNSKSSRGRNMPARDPKTGRFEKLKNKNQSSSKSSSKK